MSTAIANQPLHNALDAAAPDGGSWLAGEAAFVEAFLGGQTADQAYTAALDAAAPDQESWLAGWRSLERDNAIEDVDHGFWATVKRRGFWTTVKQSLSDATGIGRKPKQSTHNH